MRRAVLVAAGTVAGVAAVLGYHPGSLFGSAVAAPVAETAAATAEGSSSTAAAASDSATTTSATTPSAETSQTVTGDAVQTRYGPVKVEITVTGSSITDVTTVASPDGDHESVQINAYAVPQLEDQAMAAQSASIAGVSGASYTSQGFAQSLQSALAKAGLA